MRLGTWQRSVCAAVVAVAAQVAAANGPPAWFDGTRPNAQAWQAVGLLDAAATHGLDASDYGSDALRLALGRADMDWNAAERLSAALTAAVQQYLRDLHDGRVDPAQFGYHRTQRTPPEFDPAASLQTALADGRVHEAVRAAAPKFAQYERLREALASYRALTDHPAWRTPLPPLPAQRGGGRAKLEPGQTYTGLFTLRDRLIALGDLAADTPVSVLYQGALVDAVRAFQLRHGLAGDSVIGKSTLVQLEVPPAQRVRQIELTLERLRWTPLAQRPRMVVINLPEFVLRAYEVEAERIVVRATMKVIVGKALDTRTPIISEDLRSIEFSPFWNVPPSIARGELIPRLKRDPGHFEREQFEFVTPQGVIRALSPALLDDVAAGRARIRQRPGPRNALGDIKFVFPNRDHIYLHHTPAVALFERERRDFSHGCIRVEQPVALARFALQGMPEWTEARIVQAMTAGTMSTVRVAEPVPVVIAYATAIVKDGRVHFFDDIYGHDRRLDRALRVSRPALPIP